MAENGSVGAVTNLWRFPVKSMKGERLEAAALTEAGLVGDRAYALIDQESGKVASAKSVRDFPDLFACQAAFVEPPRPGEAAPPVRISLPTGKTITSDDPGTDAALSDFFGRAVTLAQAAPEDFVIDMYHPDVEGADPEVTPDSQVEQRLGASFFTELGVDSPLSAGSFLDLFPVTVMTQATVDALNRLAPESRFDERRFRMNLMVTTEAEGFVENDWVGRSLAIGEALQLDVALPDPRCVMTTLAIDELPKDTRVLRALVKHNLLPVGEAGSYPCAGVYAVVKTPGEVRRGDAVRLI